jgi:hypothetical protein
MGRNVILKIHKFCGCSDALCTGSLEGPCPLLLSSSKSKKSIYFVVNFALLELGRAMGSPILSAAGRSPLKFLGAEKISLNEFKGSVCFYKILKTINKHF